ncbi:MAG: HpcH/HpaI aldolase/citrate lyase family protein [Lachnospiraceae bacterium]|nr:HpcH/HpaI aldolase/citrate lyase family protein [Lachnospiraceae bacterium]
MKHHRYNPDFKFIVSPMDFNKYTSREELRYCLGATMYMPGTKDITGKILNNEMPGLTSMVLCFEDACPKEEVEQAEENVIRLFDTLADALEKGSILYQDVPLIFCRIRSVKQFLNFAQRLTKRHCKVLAGFNFPKFTAQNGEDYFRCLKQLNAGFGEILYGLPIIEDSTVAFKETRLEALLGIKNVLDKYKELVLQVRVGATDFSSYFGVRRGVDYSIYDILTVRECLSDILNIFSRNNAYVVSGPVWEYFRASKNMMFGDLPKYDFENCLLKRIPIFNAEVDGLLREVILDKANGFVGRTVIHPTHVKFVNAMQAVTKEEYEDACQIFTGGDGVVKSPNSNKMNEIRPHMNWAEKVLMRSKAYGVIENENSYIQLFSVGD